MRVVGDEYHGYVFSPSEQKDEKNLVRLAYDYEQVNVFDHPIWYDGGALPFMIVGLLFGAIGTPVALANHHMAMSIVCGIVLAITVLCLLAIPLNIRRSILHGRAISQVEDRTKSVTLSSQYGYSRHQNQFKAQNSYAWNALRRSDFGKTLDKLLDKHCVHSERSLKKHEESTDDLYGKVKPILDEYLSATAGHDIAYARAKESGASESKLDQLGKVIDDYAAKAAARMQDEVKAHKEHEAYIASQQTLVANSEVEAILDVELPPLT